MLTDGQHRLRLAGRKILQVSASVLLFLQTISFPVSALAESSFYFRGYNSENVTTNTFAYATSGAYLDGTTVHVTDAAEGTAVGYIALDEAGHDITTAVNLGGLEISFSTLATVALEGTDGAQNDVPSVEIRFCSDSDPDAILDKVTLSKPDNTVSGGVKLSSGASIPTGTHGIFIYLTGVNTDPLSDNTVVFSGTTCKINDAAPPSCVVSYDADWTSGDVTVTVTAADGDAGLEGIYSGTTPVATVSPYTFVVSTNNTPYSFYSKDYAGKTSDVASGTVSNIDRTAPAAPSSIPLSSEDWTNQDITLDLPKLNWGSDAPERYIYQIGSSAWQDLPGDFALTESGQYTLRVAVKDAAGNTSGSVQTTAKIDKIAPTIGDVVKTAGAGNCRVDVSYSDGGLSGLKKVCYAPGIQEASYFSDGGIDITDGTFTVYVGGSYTICVMDNAGNTALRTLSLSTVPTLADIPDQSVDEDTVLHVDLTVADAETQVEDLTIEATAAANDLISGIVVNQSTEGVSLDITPLTDHYGGPVTITVKVTDADGEETSDTFTVMVNSVNDAPTAVDDAGVTVSEDDEVAIDVLANDSDTADGDTLTISACSAPEHGEAVSVLGHVKYTPNENYAGSDSFSYTISDGNGGSATAWVYVDVTPVNDPPTALDDVVYINEDNSATIDVMENDSDIDEDNLAGDVLMLASCTNGAHGTAVVSEDKIVYTPNPDFNGQDSFTYILQDEAGATAEATVTVHIASVPDDPKFVDLEAEYNINEDSVEAAITFAITDVETPANSLMLQAVSQNEDLLPQENISIRDLGDGLPGVSVLLTPLANLNGDVPLVLTLGDGFTSVTRTVVVHVKNVNDIPTAKADSFSYTEDAEYVDIPVASLLTNDTDLDGDELTYTGVILTTTHGTLSVLNETTLRYVPSANYDGADSFTYGVTDGALTSVGTCTLTARAVNDAPTIALGAASYDTNEDEPLTGVTFDIGDQETEVGSILVLGSTSDDTIVPADGITIVNNGDGTCSLMVMPAADAFGTVVITLTASDGVSAATESFTLHIAPAPDAPVAEPDNVYVPISGKRVFSVLANDHDPDEQSLTVTGYDDSSLDGTLFFDAETQQFTYYSAIGEVANKQFTYTVSDGALTATGTVTLHINSISHAPVVSAIGDQYTEEDTTISGIAFTVTDDDYGDIQTITVASSDESIVPADASHAVVTDDGGGNYRLSLTPAENASGTVTITVVSTDLANKTDSSSFTLRVLPQNDAPIAANAEVTLNEDSSKALNLLGSCVDPDGDRLWINAVSWPQNGYLTRSGNDYTYTPYYNWHGEETLTYFVTDGRLSASATVTITVLSVNDAPVAWDDYCTLPNEIGQSALISTASSAGTARFTLLSGDYDPDGDTVYFLEITRQPSYGTLTDNEDGTITYTRTSVSPATNGADSFDYRIIDRANPEAEDVLQDTGTVHIGVVFHSSLYSYNRSVYCAEDCAPFTFGLSIGNPNGVTFTLALNNETSLGTLEVVNNNTVRFTPARDANGSDTISYTVQQADGTETSTNTIYLHVYPVNDAPVIDNAPSAISCNEDSTTGAVFNVDYSDVDCNLRDLYFYAYPTNIANGATVPFELTTQVTETETGVQVRLIPSANVNGTADLVVGVSDGMEHDDKIIPLTVQPVDDAPKLAATSAVTYEDIAVRFSLLQSDSELDGDETVLALAAGGAPAHGSVTFLSGGVALYTPAADYTGTDSFTYTLTDQTSAHLSATQTAQITVTPVNDQPEIFDLGYYQTTPEDTPTDVTLTVHDVDNDLSKAASYTIESDNTGVVAQSGIQISQVDGEHMKITITPVANASGTAKISIIASDGELTAEAAFQIKVTPVNDPPVAVDDAASVDEAVSTGSETTPPKTSVTFSLTNNDYDVEDASLKIVAIENVLHGTVVNASGGNVTVSADGNYNGLVTFSYTVMDRNGASDSADVVVTINPMNDPPKAVADSAIIDEDESVSINVLGNDSDVENDTLSISDYTDPPHGSVAPDGINLLYTPDENYYGADSFSYTLSDGNGGTATATVTLKIKPVNDPPTIAKHESNPGDWTVMEDHSGAFNFVVSDVETKGCGLLLTIQAQTSDVISTPNIYLSTNADGYKTITVLPFADASGSVPVKFTVSDGQSTTTATYTIEVVAVNDPPVAADSTITVKEDTPYSGSVSATDVENDPLTFSLVGGPESGSLTFNEDGTFTYSPAANYNGTVAFTYRANDGQDASNDAVVTIVIRGEKDLPTAADDAVETNEDTPVTIDVLSNDTDADIPYDDVLTIARTTTPLMGSVKIENGKIVYTPSENQNGSDAFSYTISDSDGNLDSAVVTVLVKPVNDAPSGGDDTATVEEDSFVTIPVTDNDDLDETTNPDLEDVRVVRVDDPAHGSASPTGDGKGILYTPDADYFGSEVFYYTARDASNVEVDFKVTVTVTPVNDPPEIRVESPLTELPDISTDEDTTTAPITFTVYDVEDDAADLDVTITVGNSALVPALSVTPGTDGSCSFTIPPKKDKVGTSTITITVKDKEDATDTDAFVLTVDPVNDKPVAQDDPATTNENTPKTINILRNDDVDLENGGDTLSIVSVEHPQYGSYTIDSNKMLIYTPDATRSNSTSYTDTFGYTMKDKDGFESSANVIVTVTPVNDAPTITEIADIPHITEDAPDGTGEIPFSVADEEDANSGLVVSIQSSNTTLFPVANITVSSPAENPTGSLRTVKAIPAANQYGTAEITLTVTDLGKLTAEEKFTVTVDSANDIPANGDDHFTVLEDEETNLDVLANDDVDGPSQLTVVSIEVNGQYGTARVAENGKSVYYITDQDSNMPDSFVYKLHDAYGNADYTFTAYIEVTPVNDAPIIKYMGLDSYTVNETYPQNGIPFIVTDVDDNTDASNGEPITVELSAKSSNSLLLKNGITINATTGDNRVINLQPYLKWNGATTVTITAKDSGNQEASCEFTFVVNSVNDPPVANDDTFTIDEDTPCNLDVLYNDRDPELLTNPGTEEIFVNEVFDNDPNADITVSADSKTVLIEPVDDYNGPVTFTYTVHDLSNALSNTATVNVTVSQVNDAPEPDADSAETTEDTPVTIDVLYGDTDIDQRTDLNEYPNAEVLSISLNGDGLRAPSRGSIAIVNGMIVYTPRGDYNGEDTFEYYCTDGEVPVKALVTVMVTQVNDAPKAKDDGATTPDEEPVSVDVLHNDTDVDTDALMNLGGVHDRSTFFISSYSFVGDETGTLSEENGVITYTPELNFTGTQEISYTLCDGHEGYATATLRVLVTAQNDPPTAHADVMETAEDHSVTLNVLSNDADQDPGDTLAFDQFLTSTAGLPGVFETDADGTVTFTPSANYHGSFTIDYRMKDAGGLAASATITVRVSAVNDVPAGQDGAATTPEDTAKAIEVGSLISDADIATDGDILTVSVAESDGPSHGALEISGTQITYTPAVNYNGLDSFVYTVTDKEGESDTGRIDLTVTPVNDAPKANADAASLDEDTNITIDVAGNDEDIDTDKLLNAAPQSAPTLLSVGTAQHGTVEMNGGKAVYTPDKDYNGTDSFTYRISDGALQASGAVSLTVRQINDPVDAVDDAASVNDGDAVTIDALGNDTDVDTDALKNLGTAHQKSDFAIESVGKPVHGTAEIVSGKIVYTADATYAGADSFDYTMTDGHGTHDTATVSITVLAANDPPDTPVVATPKDGDRAGGASTVRVEWTCSDIDGDALTYELDYYDGAAWKPVAKSLTETVYLFAIPSSLGSTQGLQFRVKASDGQLTSDYGYSGTMSVDRDAPLSVTVVMRTADGRTYTAGVWTNQTVTVTAESADDLNPVTFQYAQDGGAYSAGESAVVVQGVHSVYILATDAFDNAAEFGPYLVRVDKQAPLAAKFSESVSGGGILLKLTLQADPGGSGNEYLLLPDGTRTAARGTPQYLAAKNGTYSFTIYDAAGNRTVFTYTVSSVDLTKPTIACDAGGYEIGKATQSAIRAALTFTDAEGTITARGYQLTSSAAPGSAYRSYTGALTIGEPGTYYIHAYAINAFGLATYVTFGPFIVEAAEAVSPTPEPETRDVEVNVQDVTDVPGEPVSIRLPGQEWSQTVTLENVAPGDYLVEVMDSDGNVHNVQVHVTMRDIVARSVRASSVGTAIAIAAAAVGLAALVLLLLFAGFNITVRVIGPFGQEEKRLRTLRRLCFKKKLLLVKLSEAQTSGGRRAEIRIAKQLVRSMRGNEFAIELRGVEVLRERVSEDADEAIDRTITL